MPMLYISVFPANQLFIPSWQVLIPLPKTAKARSLGIVGQRCAGTASSPCAQACGSLASMQRGER